jgi:glucose/arabinose dehydrogenase
MSQPLTQLPLPQTQMEDNLHQSVPELYRLDWAETRYGKQPTAVEVTNWLSQQGVEVTETPKVYPNGTVLLWALANPLEVWSDFEPLREALEDKLGAIVSQLTKARGDLLDIPEHKQTAQDRAILATIALVLYGYGIEV